MLSRLSEDLDEQVGSAVDHGCLPLELLRTVHETPDVDDLRHAVERIDDAEDRRQTVDGARVASRPAATSSPAPNLPLGAHHDLYGGIGCICAHQPFSRTWALVPCGLVLALTLAPNSYEHTCAIV